MNADEDQSSPVGRPRDDQLDEAIHRATLSLLAEVGYAGLTIAEVARRASTVPPTVYRRHRNLRALVLATLHREVAHMVGHVPDLGTLRDDLIAHVSAIVDTLTLQRASIVAGLLLPMRQEPTLAHALHQGLEAVNADSWGVIIARAVDRGELDPRVDDLVVLGQVAPSVVFQRLMLLHLPVDKTFAVELVDTVLLPALRPAAPPLPPVATSDPEQPRSS